MTVHFPIVFMLSAVFFTFLYLITADPSYETTAFHCLAGGVIFTPIVMLTGFTTWFVNYLAKPLRSINIKVAVSVVMLVASLAALFWREMAPDILTRLRGTSFIYLLLIFSLCPMVLIIGWHGAKLTFRSKAKANANLLGSIGRRMERGCCKVLIAVDGSEQTQRLVDYLSGIISVEQTEIVLLHIMPKAPESFRDWEKEPFGLPNSDVLRKWDSERERHVRDIMRDIRRQLTGIGIPEYSIMISIQKEKEGIARDLLLEAQREYDAILVGPERVRGGRRAGARKRCGQNCGKNSHC